MLLGHGDGDASGDTGMSRSLRVAAATFCTSRPPASSQIADTRRRRVKRRRPDECWWRWGRIELPVQNTFPENFLQAFPANLRVRVAGPRPAGCFACYPVVPLGSLTSLTGVGGAAPPQMTPSPSGEGGRRRCSLLFRQRGRNCQCQLQACSLFYEACEQPRPAIPGSRALSKPDIPTNRLDADSTKVADRCERLF